MSATASPSEPPARTEARRQVLAVEQLHHEERLAGLGLAGVEHLDDVRALDGRDGPRLAVEARRGGPED